MTTMNSAKTVTLTCRQMNDLFLSAMREHNEWKAKAEKYPCGPTRDLWVEMAERYYELARVMDVAPK